jgi:hypothetical protein
MVPVGHELAASAWREPLSAMPVGVHVGTEALAFGGTSNPNSGASSIPMIPGTPRIPPISGTPARKLAICIIIEAGPPKDRRPVDRGRLRDNDANTR